MDGHSTDNTRDLSLKHGATYALDNRMGKGDALRLGIAHATKDVCVFIDADLSHDATDIPRLVAPILEDHADMVLGSARPGRQ